MHLSLCSCRLFAVALWAVSLQCVDAIWTEFDLVRPTNGSWGSDGTVSWRKISGLVGNGPPQVGNNSRFGWSMTNIGDLDQDGVDDLVVGAPGEASDYTLPNQWNNGTIIDVQQRTGSVYIVFMTTSGLAKNSTKISGLLNGGPMLYKDEAFGFSVASIGDLDGDGIPDIAVGAPGDLIASCYILYMNRNGTAKGNYLIRGTFAGTLPPEYDANGVIQLQPGQYLPNGPQLSFLSRFGLSMTGLGDWDGDGIPDVAVGSSSADGGNGLVYFLYMHRNGTVKSYTEIGAKFDSNGDETSVGGAPLFPGRTFVGFGSSILVMSDFDGDGISEIAIGAKDLDDGDTTHYRSGAVYVCFMNRDGSVRKYERISELSEQYNRGDMGMRENEKKKNTWYPGGAIPNVNGDQCGAALATIGDINLDRMRQQQPDLVSPDAYDPISNPDSTRVSVPDLVVGCPQTNTGSLPGRMFFYFLNAAGNMVSFTKIPSDKDVERSIFPPMGETDHLGQSLAAMPDWDNNGLREVAVGAPGSLDTGPDSGAIYILYFRRRRWHAFWTDTRAYWCAIIIPPSLLTFGICVGIAWFFWTYRRKPDEIEILVLKSGVKVEKKRKRKKKEETKVAPVDDADDF